MSIKKQFFILSAIIITVPILCALFIFTHYYVKSSDRILIEGYKQIRKMDESRFSYKDWNTLSKTVEELPLDVEAVLLSEDNNIIISSIPEFKQGNQISAREMWELVNEASDKYFYQFTSPALEGEKVTLITRTLRVNKNANRSQSVGMTFLVIIFIFVVICIISIVSISSTIFKSIVLLEDKTLQIANGNLEVEIESQTEKKSHKSNEITSIIDSIEKMKKSLAEAQNRKNKFIMGISHDLRTPVAIIKGYSEAITDGIITDPQEIKTSLELIDTKTTQLDSMIDTLINFMKLNNTELRQNLIPGSITELINNFAKESKITANVFKRNIILDINLEEDYIIPLDKQLALRAFQNLFSNALRYTNDGDTIKIISYKKEKSLFLVIQDTGIGIEEKDLKNIFDLFYRATNSRREEGMGIGLSVVKNIIDTHGWNINVESEIGKGSSFIVEIPIN